MKPEEENYIFIQCGVWVVLTPDEYQSYLRGVGVVAALAMSVLPVWLYFWHV